MAQPTKAELRKEFLAKRGQLSDAERGRLSSLIRQRIFQLPAWKNAESLLCYVSFLSEVDTHALIQEALRFKKKVVVPVHDPSDRQATSLSFLQSWSHLGPGYRNIMEVQPEFRRPADPGEIQLALVPGIVFDTQGGRIGFGGGYFDRLLPRMTKALRVGLAFSVQVSEQPLPLEPFDIRMNALVTERSTIQL